VRTQPLGLNTLRRDEEPEPEHTEKDVLIEIRDLIEQRTR